MKIVFLLLSKLGKYNEGTIFGEKKGVKDNMLYI